VHTVNSVGTCIEYIMIQSCVGVVKVFALKPIIIFLDTCIGQV
jgi:hypothetical protein